MNCNPFLIDYNALLSNFIEAGQEISIKSIVIHGNPVWVLHRYACEVCEKNNLVLYLTMYQLCITYEIHYSLRMHCTGKYIASLRYSAY